jgi:hypothetical protein
VGVVKIDGAENINPGTIFVEGWVNPDQGCAAAFEVRTDHGRWLCLTVPYRAGQKVVSTRVSLATACQP